MSHADMALFPPYSAPIRQSHRTDTRQLDRTDERQKAPTVRREWNRTSAKRQPNRTDAGTISDKGIVAV